MSSSRSRIVHLLAVILLAVNTLATSHFHCPPARDISPCECHNRPHEVVSCGGGGSMTFDSVGFILYRHFANMTIPYLHLTNIHPVLLSFRGLGFLQMRVFALSNSTIRYVTQDAFKGQTLLSVLILQNGSLEHVPTLALQKLSSLQWLSLKGNLLKRIQDGSLNNLDNLEFLKLHDNRISGIAKNAFPKNMKILGISRNFLSTFNGSLQSLEHLEEVYAYSNKLTSVKGEFDGLFRLKILNLDHNQISDISDSFSNLTSIRRLSLAGNLIRDVGEALLGLNLHFLNMSHNYITKLDRRTFENIKDLQVLDLSGNFLTAIEICPTLKPLRFLLALKLSDMRLKRLRTKCFHNMKDLMSLDLSRNELSTLWYVMTYPKDLIHLDISFNNFSSLKNLHLSNNKDLALLKMEGNPWQCNNQTTSMFRDLEEKGFSLQGHPSC